MRCVILTALVGLMLSQTAAAMEEDPVLYSLKFEQLELRETADDVLAWKAEAWIGRDRDRLLLKSEGKYNDKETEEFELQGLYARAVSPNWNLQAGWRGDFQLSQRRNWAVLALEGLAPGFIHTEVALFLGSGGRTGARLEAEYDLQLTQRLVLQPRIELDWYGKSDEVNGLGDGLATSSFGLRLRYEVRREFAPYIGFHWRAAYGETADIARANDAKVRDFQGLAGIRWWF